MATIAGDPAEQTSDLPRLDWQTGLTVTCDELRNSGISRVGLQLPEGLRGQTSAVIDLMGQRLGPETEVLVWAEPTFGACDLADRPLRELGAQALVHLGHAPMPCHADRYTIPVHFVPVIHTGELILKEEGLARLKAIFEEAETEARPMVEQVKKDRTLGLVTTAQHIHLLDELAGRLEAAGWRVLVGTGGSRLAHPGQLLGCNSSAARAVEGQVNGYLYLGTGRFHPLAVALSSRLPVATLNPHSGVVEPVDGERFLRQRFGSITKAREASRWAVLVSPQVGQCRADVGRRSGRYRKGLQAPVRGGPFGPPCGHHPPDPGPAVRTGGGGGCCDLVSQAGHRGGSHLAGAPAYTAGAGDRPGTEGLGP